MESITRLGQILAPFGVPVALVIALGNALWQSYLQDRKLRHDLFEKRFRIYESIVDVIHEILSMAPLDHIDMQDFTKHRRAAEFLLKPQIGDFMDDLYNKASRLQELITKQAELRKRGKELPEAEQSEYKNIREWFHKTPYERAKALFSPYLHL